MKQLLLAGGGHAHLEVLRQLIEAPLKGVRTTLVSMSRYHHYSGMVPGFLAGTYQEADIAFDLEALCRRAGVIFLVDQVSQLGPTQRQIVTATEKCLAYDLVSFNLGSGSAGADRPEVASAQLVKPISRAIQLRERILREGEKNPRAQISVVGAGAAGFEIACAARSLLLSRGRQPRISLFDSASQILDGYSPAFRKRGAGLLESFRIEVHLGEQITAVERDRLVTPKGGSYPSDVTIWLTGAAAPRLFTHSGLAVDDRGFLLVDDNLRSISNPQILAVGDCATLLNYPQTPKAGVYSVRQAPILWRTIRANCLGGEAMRYVPQSSFLSILNLCDGRALLRYKELVSASRWAWMLKDWIDRRFMRAYQSLVH